MLKRLPIESPTRPLELFGLLRVLMALVTLVVLLALGLPYGGKATAIVGLVLLPWSAAIVVLARRRPEILLHPAVPLFDLASLAALELAAPDTYAAVRFAALFLIAVHAIFQGERRGLALTSAGVVMLVGAAVVTDGGGPEVGNHLAFYETVFALAACSTAFMVGRLRTAESASRLRARGLSRRTLQAETEVRRHLSETIHDGPVQELIGLDMVLSAARRAAESGDNARTLSMIGEAHSLAERNIQALRDEIVDLGPYAFEELAFETAIENCLASWKRRFGFEVVVTLEQLDLAPECAGGLFRITQEAVANAGRHAHADTVAISLRSVGREVELRVADDGGGFDGEGDPLAAAQPGHLGLASMRERAEMLSGRLDIETSARGTRVLVRAPLERGRG
jgi:signal transduction histidine kinase